MSRLYSEEDRPRALHFRIIAVSWAGWLTTFASLMCLMWLAPSYRVELGFDDDDVKWIKGLALGASGLGGLGFGVLADRYGRKAALIASLVVTHIGLVLLEFGRSTLAFQACSVIIGFGMGGQWASGQMLLGETIPPRFRRLCAAIAQSGAPFGLMLAAALCLDFAPRHGWREAIRLVAGAAILIPIAYFAVPESDLWRRLRKQGAIRVRGDFRVLFRPPLLGRFLLVFLLTLCCQANYWCTVSWLPEFMNREWNLELAKSAQWTVIFAVASLVGYLSFAGVARLSGHRPAFTLFCALMATGVAMLTVFDDAIRATPDLVLGFAAVAGLGTGLWSSFGPLYAEAFPTGMRATAAGVCMNVTRGFQLFAPVLVRDVGGRTLGGGVALAAGFALIAAMLVWVIPAVSGARLDAPGGDAGTGPAPGRA